MLRAGWLDVPYVNGILSEHVGLNDGRIRELHAIRDEVLRSSDPDVTSEVLFR